MALRKLLLALSAVCPVLADICGVHGDGVRLPEFQSAQLSLAAAAPPTIDIYVHVIAGSRNRQDGWLSEAEVNGQVQVIKDRFRNSSITFNYNIGMAKWYINSSWIGQTQEFDDMKIALHRGDYKSVNLYITNLTNPNFGGICTNPWKEKTETPDKARRLATDGCVVNTQMLPGSNHPFWNMGGTAVHEIGHWFGLWHTFENQLGDPNDLDSCSPTNPDDMIIDTPKMVLFDVGKCIDDDTCEGGDHDPIHNHMSYSSDACRTEFTKGQRDRMWAIYDEFRRTGVPI